LLIGNLSGDHSADKYLTEEADPVFAASAASNISQVNIESWNTKSEFDGKFRQMQIIAGIFET